MFKKKAFVTCNEMPNPALRLIGAGNSFRDHSFHFGFANQLRIDAIRMTPR
jgi:hypothetical protein